MKVHQHVGFVLLEMELPLDLALVQDILQCRASLQLLLKELLPDQKWPCLDIKVTSFPTFFLGYHFEDVLLLMVLLPFLNHHHFSWKFWNQYHPTISLLSILFDYQIYQIYQVVFLIIKNFYFYFIFLRLSYSNLFFHLVWFMIF